MSCVGFPVHTENYLPYLHVDNMKTRSEIPGRNRSQIHRHKRFQHAHRLEGFSVSIPQQPPNKPATAVQRDGLPVSVLQPRLCARQDLAKAAREKGGTVPGPDVPVEVQTQKSLEADDREKIITSMHTEFKSRRKILLTGLPHDCCDEVPTAQSL